MNNQKNNREYYLGLDIGTDSVGYAVTDNRYKLLKFKGEPMWGSHLFDPATQAAERRGYRTARRRLDRKQQRVQLADEIFMPEVIKVDSHFYIRKSESSLYSEDSTFRDELHLFFNDKDYSEKNYYGEYPTIHHLICALMEDKNQVFDIRLINMAVDWLVAHRGHFLSDVSEENVDKVLDFTTLYNNFISNFDDSDDYRKKPWDRIDPEEMGKILKHSGVNNKKIELKELLYGKKIPDDEYFLDRKELIAFLAGGKVQCKKLFVGSEYEEDFKISISDNMEETLPKLGDDSDIIASMAAMYDWSVLSEILGEKNDDSETKYISEAKVEQYEKHRNDLRRLKDFVKKYSHDKYNIVFRKNERELKNYVAYSYHVDKNEDVNNIPKGKAKKEEFYDFLKKTLELEKIECDCEEDKAFLEEIKKRISPDVSDFMPKQVNGDNRVIPYQLYYIELKNILDNAAVHYPFLLEKDSDGYTSMEKLLSIFKFRIPYYVGPLRKDNSKNAWIVRKAEGKIVPWNFDELVDRDESEKAFINRMTNTCTYYPGANVIPKQSLLYSKFTVLNEINKLSVNDKRISVEAKQGIYNELFKKKAKVSKKNIIEYLIANNYMQKNDFVTGIDDTIKSSLKSYNDFRRLIENHVLLKEDVEKIIRQNTYTEDRSRYRKYIKDNYPQLNDEDYKYVSKLRYKDFGRLSKEFLTELEGASIQTGEKGSIMHFLWEENVNIMELLSDKYTFMDELSNLRQEYYAQKHVSVSQQMEEMGISSAVKRPVTRTLDVIKDVVSTMGCAPKKIFVEMARGPEEKRKRSVTRKDQLLDLYKVAKMDTLELEKQLREMGDTANNRLQSEKLFLYYLQLGKCMYSGEPIDLSQIGNEKIYDVDHIYPQSKVKDDSFNNKVLVLSKYNGIKGDKYPINAEWQKKMESYWKLLLDNGLMSKEKYARLTRKTTFTEEELEGFINRQLVETRQSMKAVTQLLEYFYKDSEVIYVKASLAADFKRDFELTPKSRLINDLHHAKDAYLNIVCGNVYHEKFTKKWFRITDERYSMKTKNIFLNSLERNGVVIWDKDEDLKNVKKNYEKNHIHLTKYAYCQKGGLFDQMPLKKGLGQMPLKHREGMDDKTNIEKYGGYNKITASFYVLARYIKGKKKEISFVPVNLNIGERFMSDDSFALEYCKDFLKSINSKEISDIDFPMGKRQIKIKTVLSLDGYRVWINGKDSGGKLVLVSNAESLILKQEYVKYIKAIESYVEKKKENKNFEHDELFDGLSKDKNLTLFDELCKKIRSNLFMKIPTWQGEVVKNGRELFEKLDFYKQLLMLISIISLMKSGRAAGCDLSLIGGSGKSGTIRISANFSNYKYSDFRVIDVSPAGLHEKSSQNIMDYLK